MSVDLPSRVLNGHPGFPAWISYHIGIFLVGLFVILFVLSKFFGNVENWTKRQKIITLAVTLIWLAMAFPIALMISQFQLVS